MYHYFACTITLRPRYHQYTVEGQLEFLFKEIQQRLRPFGTDIKITLVGELTKACNVHGHGVIAIKSTKSYKNCKVHIHDLFRKNPVIGICCFKEIHNIVIWYEYFSKSIQDNKEIFSFHPVLFDDLEMYYAVTKEQKPFEIIQEWWDNRHFDVVEELNDEQLEDMRAAHVD